MLHVFVVSPVPAVRAGLRALIAQDEALQVAGEAAHLEPVPGVPGGPFAGSPGVDVVVVDPAAGPDSGEIVPPADGQPGPALVILGPIPGDERLPGELAGRAWAYIPREAGPDQLLAAIHAVAAGLVAIDAGLASHLLAGGAAGASGVAGAAKGEDLTGREQEVLALVALGLPNKTIARRLGISEHTVKFHVAAVLAKLGAASRTEAVRLGARRGLVAL